MKWTQYLPTLLIAIDTAASIGYAIDGDLRLTLYWLSAALLTFCVTFPELF